MAVALVAAACGAEVAPSLDVSVAADGGAETQTVEPAPETDTDVAESSDSSGDEEAEAAGPAPVISHVFPNLETVNIVDGQPLNLADELAGGDTPVLLWFWAPH